MLKYNSFMLDVECWENSLRASLPNNKAQVLAKIH